MYSIFREHKLLLFYETLQDYLGVLTEPPMFKIEPTNMRIDLGNTVVMDCVAEGEPTPDISWLRGWRDIVTGERISVLPNNSLR